MESCGGICAMGSLAEMNGDRSAAQSIRPSFEFITIPPMVSGILSAPGLIRAPMRLIRVRQADVDRETIASGRSGAATRPESVAVERGDECHSGKRGDV